MTAKYGFIYFLYLPSEVGDFFAEVDAVLSRHYTAINQIRRDVWLLKHSCPWLPAVGYIFVQTNVTGDNGGQFVSCYGDSGGNLSVALVIRGAICRLLW